MAIFEIQLLCISLSYVMDFLEFARIRNATTIYDHNYSVPFKIFYFYSFFFFVFAFFQFTVKEIITIKKKKIFIQLHAVQQL